MLCPSFHKFPMHSTYRRNNFFLTSIIKPNLSFSNIITLNYFLLFSYAYIDLNCFLHLNWSNWNWNWAKYLILLDQQFFTFSKYSLIIWGEQCELFLLTETGPGNFTVVQANHCLFSLENISSSEILSCVLWKTYFVALHCCCFAEMFSLTVFWAKLVKCRSSKCLQLPASSSLFTLVYRPWDLDSSAIIQITFRTINTVATARS